ncbi:MAG: peptide-methionine (R)-S-oxide reductase MsrB [Mariniphaga sp.]
MKTRISLIIIIAFFSILIFKVMAQDDIRTKKLKEQRVAPKVVKTDDAWEKELSPLQYEVTRKKGTERAFTGQYYDFYEKGFYTCSNCGALLFDSGSKFKSGCGWPSFSDVTDLKSINIITDKSYGMVRTEITCANCEAHLGHVFEDGPPPTGLRYCINSVSIKFNPSPEKTSKTK